VVCLGPRDPGEIVGPRPLAGVVVRPLNFTVRRTRYVLKGICVIVGLLLLALAAFFLPRKGRQGDGLSGWHGGVGGNGGSDSQAHDGHDGGHGGGDGDGSH
jgi:hypothetical protein